MSTSAYHIKPSSMNWLRVGDPSHISLKNVHRSIWLGSSNATRFKQWTPRWKEANCGFSRV